MRWHFSKTSNIQHPEKIQGPTSATAAWALDLGAWRLDLLWILDVGCWMLDVGCFEKVVEPDALRRLLFPPLSRRLRHLFGRDISLVRSNAPEVAKRIDKLRVPIAPKHIHRWHHPFGALRHGFVEDGISIRRVDHHATGRRRPGLRSHRAHLWILIPEHHNMISDLELRVSDFRTARIVHSH